MRTLRFLSAVSFIFVGVIYVTGRAQTQPQPFDLTATLAALEHDAPQEAAKRLAALPPNALPAIEASFYDDQLTPKTHQLIADALPRLTARNFAARLAADQRIDEEWNRRTGVDTYKASGKHDPAWDALAIDALSTDGIKNPADCYKKLKAAVDAGCKDPLVRYYEAKRGYQAKLVPLDLAISTLTSVANELDASPYSPGRRYFARLFLVELLREESATPSDVIKSNLEKCLALLPELASEHPSLCTSMR